jgi:hypothetical protein
MLERSQMQQRAGYWYHQVRPRLIGLARARADTRLRQLPIVYLIDLDEGETKLGPWKFGKGTLGNPDASPISFKEKRSLSGLGLHPPQNGISSVRYRLDKGFQYFHSSVALNDTAGKGANTPITFQVVGDGRVLWTSKPVQATRIKQECWVNVSGVSVLELQVSCPGRAEDAHAVWLEPHLLKDASTPN